MDGACPFAAQPSTRSGVGTTPSCPLGFVDAASGSSTSTGRAVTCPLGFGAGGTHGAGARPTAASFASSGLPRMSLGVLNAHPTLVSIKGVIFDVSDDERYQVAAGGALAALGGHDASRSLALSTADDERSIRDALDQGLERLSYEQHQRLETYFLEAARVRRAVAVLTDTDHMRIFGTPVITGDASYSPAGASLAPGRDGNTSTRGDDGQERIPAEKKVLVKACSALHASVGEGNAEAAAGIILQHEQRLRDSRKPDDDGEPEPGERRKGLLLLVDCVCPRTGMTPLLKAVEAGSEGVVRVLLEAGADVRLESALYDGDDALGLAKRLGCSAPIVEMIQLAASRTDGGNVM